MPLRSTTNIDLASKADLEIGPTGGIEVNRYMQTNDADIFACGDCAEKVSFFDGKPSKLKLASIATMEARVVGANLFGPQRVNMGVIGVYSTVLGDTAFAAAGLNETQAEDIASIGSDREPRSCHRACGKGRPGTYRPRRSGRPGTCRKTSRATWSCWPG